MKVNCYLGKNSGRQRQNRGHQLSTILLAFCVEHCGGDASDFRQIVTRTEQRIEGQAGVNGATTEVTAGYGGRSLTMSDAGRASVAGNAGTSLAPRSTQSLISEIKIDPPGADGDFEFIELKGEPTSILSGYYLVAIEGDAESNTGQVDTVVDLSKCANGTCQFDQRGFLVIAAGSPFPNAEDAAIRESKELSRGGLENGTTSLLLMSGEGVLRGGTDLDADDDGQLELPIGATVADAVSWTDGDANDRNYAAVVLGPNPKPHAAWNCTEEEGRRVWYSGQLMGESATLELDSLHTTPQGLLAPQLTPGHKNACERLSSGGSSSNSSGAAGIAGASMGAAAATPLPAGGVAGSPNTDSGVNSKTNGGATGAAQGHSDSAVAPSGGFEVQTPIAVTSGGTAARTVGGGGTRTTGASAHASGGAPASNVAANTSEIAGAEGGASAVGTPLIVHATMATGSGGGMWWTPSPTVSDNPSAPTTTAGAPARLSSGSSSTSTGHVRPEVPGGCTVARAGGLSRLSSRAFAIAILLARPLRKLASRLTTRRRRQGRIGVLRTTGLTALAPV